MPITLFNSTKVSAQYLVLKGDQIVASLPATAAGGSVTIPTDNIYTVSAQTTIDSNVYTSAQTKVNSGVGFRAEIKQDFVQQTYVFEMVEIPASKPNQLEFEKTCKSDVIFTIYKDGKPLQPVALTNAFLKTALALSDTYSISAIIDGITTDTITTTNSNATINAVYDTATGFEGYVTLVLN